ncbi:MAG: hypothetical protein GC188_12060 [Alphaproteobacteria bacterium]|nr:hypothetical protein [Alphaproteobacteria bacterium]
MSRFVNIAEFWNAYDTAAAASVLQSAGIPAINTDWHIFNLYPHLMMATTGPRFAGTGIRVRGRHEYSGRRVWKRGVLLSLSKIPEPNLSDAALAGGHSALMAGMGNRAVQRLWSAPVLQEKALLLELLSQASASAG